MVNIDISYLEMIVQLDNIVRTTGWYNKWYLVIQVLNCVRDLDDNGYDTITNAILEHNHAHKNELANLKDSLLLENATKDYEPKICRYCADKVMHSQFVHDKQIKEYYNYT